MKFEYPLKIVAQEAKADVKEEALKRAEVV